MRTSAKTGVLCASMLIVLAGCDAGPSSIVTKGAGPALGRGVETIRFIPSDVAFDGGALSASATSTLDNAVNWLRAGSDRCMAVQAHVSSGAGDAERASVLNRARIVSNYTAAQGIPRHRVDARLVVDSETPGRIAVREKPSCRNNDDSFGAVRVTGSPPEAGDDTGTRTFVDHRGNDTGTPPAADDTSPDPIVVALAPVPSDEGSADPDDGTNASPGPGDTSAPPSPGADTSTPPVSSGGPAPSDAPSDPPAAPPSDPDVGGDAPSAGAGDPGTETSPPDPTAPPGDTPPVSSGPGKSGSTPASDRVDAGRGNGNESGGDPGKSGGKNQGGDVD